MAQKTYISLDKLRVYDEKLKALMNAQDAANLKEAKDYADSLAENYDAAGSASTALDQAKAYADGKDGAIAEAKQAGVDAAAAAAVADGKAVAAQESVDSLGTTVEELDAYIGEIPEGYTQETVIAYINKKAEETLSAAQGGSSETAASVKAQLDTYKSENDARVLAVEGNVADLEGAIATEQGRAEGVEAGLETRLKAVEDDHLVATDRNELEELIEANAAAIERLTNGVSAEEIDGVNDLINYVKEHGAEVTGIKEDISENAEAIDGVKGRMTTAEGKITAVEGAVATKAEQEYVDEKIGALEDADEAQAGRIKALEDKFGGADGSVEDQIADAKAEAISEATATAATDATNKANAAEKNAKDYADDLDDAMNIRVEALELIDHDHANKAELDLIASGDKAKWDDAAAIAHAHDNKSVIDTITAQNVSTWNTVSSKAAQSDLTAVGDRVTTLETWHNNFIEVSEAEINAMFA